MFAGFDEPFGALNGELRDARVTFDVGVVGAGHQFRLRVRTAEIGDLFGPFIDKQNNDVHVLVIFRNRLGDVMQERRLASAGRGDNQTALTHAERRHQIHDARRVPLRICLKLDPFVRVNRGKLFKRSQTLIFRRFVTVNCQQLD